MVNYGGFLTRKGIRAAAASLVLSFASAAFALDFNFVKGPGLQALEAGSSEDQQIAAQVYSCFEAAGQIWSRRLGDDITVNVEIDYQVLASGVLGSTSSSTTGKYYSQLRSAMIADAMTVEDGISSSYLQNAGALDMLRNDTADPIYADYIRDTNTTANNNYMNINTANAKALAMVPSGDPAMDGYITFTSSYDWDFDRSDGISSGAFDFTSTAAHEMAHMLGFVSGVDTMDYYSMPDGDGGPLDLENYRVVSTLDLFRYTASSLALDNQPTGSAVIAMTTEDGAFLSLDGGQSVLAQMASGVYNGDGYQASHWQYGSDTGIMVPLLLSGYQRNISDIDLVALDIIGYDRLPASYGDYNDDGAVDAEDIDALQAALAGATGDLDYDINYDETFDSDDLTALLHNFAGGVIGDANLDGEVNLDDFIVLKQNYGSSPAGWASGDFNGDATVNLDDFIILKQNYGSTLAEAVSGTDELAPASSSDSANGEIEARW